MSLHPSAVLLLITGLLATAPSAGAAQAASDSLAVAATVEAFHEALARGDSAGALALLASDAMILEAGTIENREQYRAHHLAADIQFTRALPGTTGPLRVVLMQDVAWATSTSSTVGTYEGRPVDSQGAELMVLSRGPEGWRIRAIHWSSRSRRGGG